MALEGFESPEHEREFIAHVNQGRVSLKFAYSGYGAIAHDNLARQASYHDVVGHASLEAECLRRSAADLSDVCELGPGNGVHSAALLLALEQTQPVRRYLAMDFSEGLLAICLNRIKHALSGLECSARIWDVELGPSVAIDQWRHGPTLLWFIGHTIGNLHDPAGALTNIYRSLQPGDRVLISVALRSESAADLLESYCNPAFTAAALAPFRMIGLDLPDEALRLSVDRHGSVVGYVELPTTTPRPDSLTGAPQIIECFLSRRFELPDIISLVELAGFAPLAPPTLGPGGRNAALLVGLRGGL